MTLSGRNFGAGDMPLVYWKDTSSDTNIYCIIQTFQHDQITCTAPAGQGKDLPLYISNGPGVVLLEGQGKDRKVIQPADSNYAWKDLGLKYARTSDPYTFNYDAPSINNINVLSGTTSGLKPTSGRRLAAGDAAEPQLMTITGRNFGTIENEEIQINFYPNVNEARTLPFVSSGAMIISHTHTEIVFQQPPGYGINCKVTVVVAGRESIPHPDMNFNFIAPTVTNVSFLSFFSKINTYISKTMSKTRV